MPIETMEKQQDETAFPHAVENVIVKYQDEISVSFENGLINIASRNTTPEDAKNICFGIEHAGAICKEIMRYV